ncbi:MAG: hypothetical protein HZA16_07300 [Nitrospirae bacterium]|nr:hypothetical protein [Nitrospirota bacterium]
MAECIEKLIKEFQGILSRKEILEIRDKIESRVENPNYRYRHMTDKEYDAFKESVRGMTKRELTEKHAEMVFKESLHEKQETLRRIYLQVERTDLLIERITEEGQETDKKGRPVGHVNALIRLLVGDVVSAGKKEAKNGGSGASHFRHIN